MRRNRKIILALAMALAMLGGVPRFVDSQTRVSVGVTETMESYSPYGDSADLLYGIWCQVMGCIGSYDFDKGEYVGMLAERWEVKDPKTWHLSLRKNARFHDGSPVTAADVVHSFNRMKNDP